MIHHQYVSYVIRYQVRIIRTVSKVKMQDTPSKTTRKDERMARVACSSFPNDSASALPRDIAPGRTTRTREQSQNAREIASGYACQREEEGLLAFEAPSGRCPMDVANKQWRCCGFSCQYELPSPTAQRCYKHDYREKQDWQQQQQRQQQQQQRHAQ